jgi:hypothetical protein
VLRTDEDALLELLELLVPLNALLLLQCAVHADRREVALDEQLVELVGAGRGADKDDDLWQKGDELRDARLVPASAPG